MLSLVSGIIGFGLLLLAHMLSLFGRIDQEKIFFNLLNFMGACMLVYYVAGYGMLSITLLPGLWALVTLGYMLMHIESKVKKHQQKKMENR